MRRAMAVALLLFLFRALPALAQFEGIIDMKMTRHVEGAPRSVSYSMSVKGEMLAAQAGEGEGSEAKGKFIFRGDRKVMWVVDDQAKTYLEISLTGDAGGKKKGGSGPRRGDSNVKLRKAGRTESILGYPCEEWVAEDTGTVTHIWGTPKLGNVYEGLMKSFEKMNPSLAESQMSGWEGELAKMKVFPLRILSMDRGEKGESGDTTESQEVTRIDSRHLEAALFDPPPGYKKQSLDVDMGKMMDQLQEQLKSRHGRGGDSSLNRENLEKLMKEMQEQGGKEEKDPADSSNGHQ